MKHIVPLVVASLMLAIATAMLEDGPLTLPFLAGYLLGIVVPVVVFTGILTLVVGGIHRVYTGRDMPNLGTAMWGIWVLVAAVNFYGNYQSQQERRAEQARLAPAGQLADPYMIPGQQSENGPARPSAVLALQSRFAQDARQLDAELAREVATVQIPPLFDPEFLTDKSRFPAAIGQLEDYGQVFQQHKDKQMDMLSRMRTEIEQLDLPQNEILQAIQEFTSGYFSIRKPIPMITRRSCRPSSGCQNRRSLSRASWRTAAKREWCACVSFHAKQVQRFISPALRQPCSLPDCCTVSH